MRIFQRTFLTILLLISGYFVNAYAEKITAYPCEKATQLNMKTVATMSQWLDYSMNHHYSYTAEDMDRFFDPHIIMLVNDKIVANNRKELQQHFAAFPNNTSKIVHNIKEVVATGDKVVQKLTINMKGEQNKDLTLHVIVIYTLKNSKIIRWDEVFSAN